MLIKAGVDISRLKPPIRKKLYVIETVVEHWTGQELVITSTYEGTHMASSLHYADLAVDIRKTDDGKTIVDKLAQALGNDYDIVLEANHIHIEYDPAQGDY